MILIIVNNGFAQAKFAGLYSCKKVLYINKQSLHNSSSSSIHTLFPLKRVGVSIFRFTTVETNFYLCGDFDVYYSAQKIFLVDV